MVSLTNFVYLPEISTDIYTELQVFWTHGKEAYTPKASFDDSKSITHVFCSSIVEPGHRAFKFNKFSGVQDNIVREGWHFKLPYFERPIIYDVRTHPKQIKSVTGSKGKSKHSHSHQPNLKPKHHANHLISLFKL